MAIEEVTVTQNTCDGCGSVQYGELGNGVHGIKGKAYEHTPSGGGNGGEWFACQRKCINDAVRNVLDKEY